MIPLPFKLEVKDRLDPRFDDLLLFSFMSLFIYFTCSSLSLSSILLNSLMSFYLILIASSFLLISAFKNSI